MKISKDKKLIMTLYIFCIAFFIGGIALGHTGGYELGVASEQPRIIALQVSLDEALSENANRQLRPCLANEAILETVTRDGAEHVICWNISDDTHTDGQLLIYGITYNDRLFP